MSRAKNDIVPPIPDTPENVARAIMKNPPKKEWDYLKREDDRKMKEKKAKEKSD
jgi:hypothetical protein